MMSILMNQYSDFSEFCELCNSSKLNNYIRDQYWKEFGGNPNDKESKVLIDHIVQKLPV